MIDPRFANGGAVPFVPGYGAQQVPFYQDHHHHHHQHQHHHGHHRKNKQGGVGDSPVSRDESIHKVDHGHHHFQQNDAVQFGGGYGVPYGTGGFPQQQQFVGGNYGYGNQYQGNIYDQGIAAPPAGKHRRRHHRHHHHQHAAEAANASGAADQAQGIPEQLIGQRSSSVLGNEEPQVNSPHPPEGGSAGGEHAGHRRHRRRRHHHHHGDEQTGHGQTQQSHQGHTSAGADGYGHINDDLIFIERGEHSPHRQEPPAGYDYKGKIEVQSIDKEHHSHSQGQSFVHPSGQPVAQASNFVQPGAASASLGLCPPGWQQMVLAAAPGGPCPPGSGMYSGQLVGHAGIAQAGLGGIGSFGGATSGIGFGGVGPIGAAGLGGGLDNLAANLPFPAQGQLIADYIVESNAGGVSSSGGSGLATDYQQTGGSGTVTDYQQTSGSGFSEQQEHVSSRATIIEVWQKRNKSETQEKPHHPHPHPHTHTHTRTRSRSPKPGPTFDFERFRNDILGAIERMAQTSGTGARIQWTGHDGGTQTQIHPTYTDKKEIERRPTGSGEVRVIVQPIQPVFYMPRQNETAATTTATQHIGPAPTHVPISGPGPAPAIQQTSSGGPHIVYVPRNVYVPVIKPVFVPRERVIVRPQVIHVARPVLVDRPVPVTQRPIIIDRERPIPVPVRGAGQATSQAGGTRSTGEEYVYRDNLPVAYGGRVDEYAGAANYGYTPSQQEHQYAASSTHEVASGYQTQAPVINVEVPEQYQHSQSATQLNVEQGAGSYHGSYANLAQATSASAANVTPLHCTEPIEVFNTTVNASYQSSGAPMESFHTTVNTGYQNSGAPLESYNTTVNASYQRTGAPMEVLDATINPNWQRTDKTSLVRRYGRPAYDIVQRTDQVEQQMYQELRQRSSSGGVQRSDSAASYGSGSGIAVNSGGGFAGSAGSYSSLGDIQNLHQGGYNYQSSASETVCVNY